MRGGKGGERNTKKGGRLIKDSKRWIPVNERLPVIKNPYKMYPVWKAPEGGEVRNGLQWIERFDRDQNCFEVSPPFANMIVTHWREPDPGPDIDGPKEQRLKNPDREAKPETFPYDVEDKVIRLRDARKKIGSGWYVFTDPGPGRSVHVVHWDAIIGISKGALDLNNEDRQAVARAVMREWLLNQTPMQ